MRNESVRIAVVLVGLCGGLMAATTAAACSLSAWSSTSGTPIVDGPGGSPAVARYSGFCAMQADEIGDFVTDDSPESETVYIARFYVYTGSHAGDSVDIFQARNDNGFNMVRVQYTGTQFVFTMNGTGTSRSASVAPNRWYSVELDWVASESGGLGIALQGAGSATPIQVTPISGVNNVDDRISEARLGKIAGAGSGFMNFDAFDSLSGTVLPIAPEGSNSARSSDVLFGLGTRIFENGFEEIAADRSSIELSD